MKGSEDERDFKGAVKDSFVTGAARRRGHGDVQAAQVVVINGGIFGKEEGRGRDEMIKRE